MFFYILGGSHGPVQWSREETRNQEVVRSNPGTRWTIFMLNCCKIWIIWLKRLKINKKRLGLARQKVVNLQLQLLFEEATTTMTTKTYQQSIFPCQNECKIMSENCVDSKKKSWEWVEWMKKRFEWASSFVVVVVVIRWMIPRLKFSHLKEYEMSHRTITTKLTRIKPHSLWMNGWMMA